MSNKSKPHLNLIIIGHIDNGKSTLMGHLLVATGSVSEREAREIEKLAKDNDRESFKFAYFMDALKEERARGITIDLAFKKFETAHREFTIIDAPGHQDFVKNMITGASQADAAILVVSGKKGEMETGISDVGQTREHAFLAKTLGIKQVIVAVNKIDDWMPPYSEERFNECVREIGGLLKLVGYKDADYQFIPVSAYAGDNLKDPSPKMPWWKGTTLLEAIDNIRIPEKPTGKPLRVPIQDVYKIKGAGVVPVGRVETGVMRMNQKVVVNPGGFASEIKSIEMHHEALQEAEPGANVGFNIRNATMKELKRGNVVGSAEAPPACVKEDGYFKIHGIVIWHPSAITVGYTPVVHCHTAQIACKFVALENKMDAKTGQVIETEPKFLKKGDAGVIRLQPIKKFALEKYKEFPELGRVAVRDSGKTVCVGVVLDIKENA